MALAADFHSGYAFVPALDYLPRAKLKHEGLAAVNGAIELLAIRGQPAGVMHADGFSCRGGGAGSLFEAPILKAGRGRLPFSFHFGGAGIVALGVNGDRGEKREKRKKDQLR